MQVYRQHCSSEESEIEMDCILFGGGKRACGGSDWQELKGTYCIEV